MQSTHLAVQPAPHTFIGQLKHLAFLPWQQLYDLEVHNLSSSRKIKSPKASSVAVSALCGALCLRVSVLASRSSTARLLLLLLLLLLRRAR